MFKKFTLFLFVLLFGLIAYADNTVNYNGKMTTTGNKGQVVDNNAVVIMEDNGRGVYNARIPNFTLYFKGRVYNAGTIEFSNMMAMPDDDDDDLWVVSGNKFVDLLDFMSEDELYGDAFFGYTPSMLGVPVDTQVPVSMVARFNDNYMSAQFECVAEINITYYGYLFDIINERVTKDFVSGTQGPALSPGLYLIGSFNDWDKNNMVPLTKTSTGKWTVTQTMEANAEFKLRDEKGYWYGAVGDDDLVFTKNQVTVITPIPLEQPGMSFVMPVAGTWTITADKTHLMMVVSGEWNETVPDPDPDPVDVYVLGEVNANTWAPNVGLKMTKDPDANIYYADIVGSGLYVEDDNFYSFFSFTTKLAEGDNDWDAIAPYRFGAVSNGDFHVTEDMLGMSLSLTNENGQAFRIPNGAYTLSVNLDEMKLTILKKIYNLKEGDMNGDDVVDVADVNAAINIILERKTVADYPGNADLTGDGIIDISDVNRIINIILTE
ncbi:MAG: hypothetical protein J5565_01080 [Muribaculaceae bacterium]|nr:hypothetical protein [Muribaculaceae bacterium]